MRLTIDEPINNSDEAINLLETVAALISDGYTEGYYPRWTLTEDES